MNNVQVFTVHARFCFTNAYNRWYISIMHTILHAQKCASEPQDHRLTYQPDELAITLGVGRQAVYRGLREGTIPSIRVGKRFIIPKSAIQEWLANAAAR